MSEHERLEEFVAHSEALAGRNRAPDPHREVLQHAIELGRAGEACTATHLDDWAGGLALALDADESHELATWIAERFGTLFGKPFVARGLDASAAVDALAEVLERLTPVNARLARLLCAWASELCGRPFFCFRPADAEVLNAGDPSRLRLLLAGKLRISVYDLEHQRAEWVDGDAGAGTYRVPSKSTGGLIVEWHELQAAEARWRQ